MEPAEGIESPGKYLKTMRESRKLPLEQVADATRIRQAILRALEADQYEDLPDLYVKSFMSAYAGYLGLDPNEVIQLHQKHLKNLPSSRGKARGRQSVFRKRRVNVRRVTIIISVMLLAALLAYASFKVLPRLFPNLRTEESTPSSSATVPSFPPVKKDAQLPRAEQPETNEMLPGNADTNKEP